MVYKTRHLWWKCFFVLVLDDIVLLTSLLTVFLLTAQKSTTIRGWPCPSRKSASIVFERISATAIFHVENIKLSSLKLLQLDHLTKLNCPNSDKQITKHTGTNCQQPFAPHKQHCWSLEETFVDNYFLQDHKTRLRNCTSIPTRTVWQRSPLHIK